MTAPCVLSAIDGAANESLEAMASVVKGTDTEGVTEGGEEAGYE